MMQIAVDFDGTIADHKYPCIGDPVPGAFRWMKRFQKLGGRLILWTMRSDLHTLELTEAVNFCRDNGVVFWAVNGTPNQKRWTGSAKVYAQIYIDDAAFGCPLVENPIEGARPYVDWKIVGPAVAARIKKERW